jgi:hypothetical protein
MRRLSTRRWVLFGIIAVIFAGLGWLLYLAIPDHERWATQCANSGGHVQTETSTYETFKYVEGEQVAQTHTVNTHFGLSGRGEIMNIRR